MARLETGEVSLTTSIFQVSVQVVGTILARNAALGEFHAQREAIQLGHPRGLSQGKPAFGVKAAGQFDLHVALSFSWRKRQAPHGLVIEIKSNAHKQMFSLFRHSVKNTAVLLIGALSPQAARR